MMTVLNRKVAEQQKAYINQATQNGIIHFGVGGFHRSHQAYAIQLLIEQFPELADEWSICGVGIMPNDKILIDQISKQNHLYSLKMSDHLGNERVKVISSMNEILFGPEDPQAVIEKMASATSKIISFTITEGGYNINETTGEFNLLHPSIQADLNKNNAPVTVFGYVARAIALRKERNLPPFTLLSCDNVQENGEVLEKAVMSFLKAYDSELVSYAKEKISFPNSMVDRITPVTTPADRDQFEITHGYRDEALVVSEQFFQWVIERKVPGDFPPLEKVGVEVVDDVRPYEKMKLRILNGGHSLTGLIGKALGYEYIHDAVLDEDIAGIFLQYDLQEVIPSLEPIKGTDFRKYYELIRERFSNQMINDSTNRIIGHSTAKIPKFVLPVIEYQLEQKKSCRFAALIIAAWWWYLDQHYSNNSIDTIDDDYKHVWKEKFDRASGDIFAAFVQNEEVFGKLSSDPLFLATLQPLVRLIQKEGMRAACLFTLKNSAG